MNQFGGKCIAVLAVLLAPAFASAAIIVNVGSANPTISASPQDFTLDVTFSNDGSAQPLAGYDATMLITTSSSGLSITGVGTGANKPANPVFSADPAYTSVNSGGTKYLFSYAQLSAGSIPIGTSGLYRILLHANALTTGTFTISFFQDEPNNTSGLDTKLYSDSSLNEVPGVTFGTGTVTFSPVPEPSTLGLALLGLPLLARRRR